MSALHKPCGCAVTEDCFECESTTPDAGFSPDPEPAYHEHASTLAIAFVAIAATALGIAWCWS